MAIQVHGVTETGSNSSKASGNMQPVKGNIEVTDEDQV